MADIFRRFVKHMDGINKAALADAAAKVMAEHCDERILEVRQKLRDLIAVCRECAEGSKYIPEAKAYRSMATKIASIEKRL